jgi:hypothetical protein
MSKDKNSFRIHLEWRKKKKKTIRLQDRRIKLKERFIMMRYEINNLNKKLVCYGYHEEWGGNWSLDDVTEISLKDNENKLKYFIMQELYKLNISQMNINIFNIEIVYDDTKKNKPIKKINVPVDIRNYFSINLNIDVEENNDVLLSLDTIFETNLLNAIQSIKEKENILKYEISQEIVYRYESYLLIDYDVATMS